MYRMYFKNLNDIVYFYPTNFQFVWIRPIVKDGTFYLAYMGLAYTCNDFNIGVIAYCHIQQKYVCSFELTLPIQAE